MRTFNASKMLAASLVVAGLVGATSSAFADEYISQQNKEQYAVSAGEATAQRLLPREAAPMSNVPGTSLAPAAAPAYGPFSDQDPHSGPSQNG